MKRRLKFFLFAGGAVILLAVVFYLGLFIGAARIATKDVTFNAAVHLGMATTLRNNEQERLQERLDTLLLQDVVAMGEWSHRATSNQKRLMFQQVRNIHEYYLQHHDGKLALEIPEKPLPPLGSTEEDQLRFYHEYNAKLKATVERAFSSEELEEYKKREEKQKIKQEELIRKIVESEKD